MDLKHLQDHWNRFGEDDPLWAVLTSPEKKHGRWDKEEFLQAGVAEIASVLDLVDRVADKEGNPCLRGRSLDFGCGVGRLTQALGDHFERSDGVDIAPSMLKTAEEWNRHGARCVYHLNTRDDLTIFADDSFDFIYTAHVLQHMEPKYSQKYIEEFLRVLKPHGYLLFEVVTERVTGASQPLEDDGFAANIGLPAEVPELLPGQRFMLPVRLENVSRQTWPAAGIDGWYMVTAGNHWSGPAGEPLAVDDGRAHLPRDVHPGDSLTVELEVTAPARPGRYRLEVDLVQEGVAWFSDRGSRKADIEVVVAGRDRPRPAALERLLARVRRSLPGGAKAASSEPVMEMYGRPEGEVKSIVESHHGQVLEVIDWDEFSDSTSTDWIRRGFLVTKAQASASASGQTIVLDYPVDTHPRYGHGRPPHPGLYEMIDGERTAYAERLSAMLQWKTEMAKVKVQDADPLRPCWDNGFLPGLDAISLYSLLRSDDPRHFLEIGSGTSTKFARKAIDEGGLRTEITSIDPHPRSEIDQLCDHVIRNGLESTDLKVFDVIEPGDVVFLDGSHRIFMNSDVTVFWLEVLPRLPAGVLVEVHDIYLPYDYPPEWADRWYSEQYLLAAQMLFGPNSLEVVLPNTFISCDPELSHALDQLWAMPGLETVERHGGSFWFRTQA